MVPVPAASAFGHQTLIVEVAESRAIERIKYSTENSTTQALGAIGDVAGLGTSIDNAQAAADKAEVDRIAAKQRLVKCQADPDDC